MGSGMDKRKATILILVIILAVFVLYVWSNKDRVLPPDDDHDLGQSAHCFLSGARLAIGESGTFYSTRYVSSPLSCEAAARVRSCQVDGLDGSSNYHHLSCTEFASDTGFADIPEWFDSNRVQILGQGSRIAENSTWFDAIERAVGEGLGVSVYQRMGHYMWDSPMFPSQYPKGADGQPLLADTRDYVAEFSERAKAQGLHMGLYYWDAGEGVPKNVPKSALPLQDRALQPWFRDLLASPRHQYQYNWQPAPDTLCRRLRSDRLIEATPQKISGEWQTRGYFTDFSSTHRELLLNRMKELADRRVEMFYFDERHLPDFDTLIEPGTGAYSQKNYPEPRACFGGPTEERYIATFGSGAMPSKESWEDANFRKYVIFQGHIMAEMFRYLKQETQAYVREKYPDQSAVFIVSSTYLSVFTHPHMTLRLLEEASDVAKVEYTHGVRDFLAINVFDRHSLPRPPFDVRLALGFLIPRDASSGRPPLIWYHDFKDEHLAKAYAASVLAYGGIPNFDMDGWHVDCAIKTLEQGKLCTNPVPCFDPDKDGFINAPDSEVNTKIRCRNADQEYAAIKSAVELSKSISEVMAGARPYKFAAIHLSETNRNDAVNHGAVWRQLMWPVSAALHGLIRSGLPSAIITDRQIEQGLLKEYQVLIMPSANLPASVRDRVNAYERAGGKVIYIDSKLSYDSKKKANQALVRIGDVMAALKDIAPYYVSFENTANDMHPHAVFHQTAAEDTLVAMLVNDFRFVTKYRGQTDRPSSVTNARVWFVERPEAVSEVLTGSTLKIIHADHNGATRYYVEVPEFDIVSALEIRP